ncbi:MAG: hypothetical protein WCI36_03035 [bacterium]
MQKLSKNKMVGSENDSIVKKDKFFYPDYQVTIEANSKEEADKIIEEKFKNK